MLLNEFLREHKAFLEEQRRMQEQDCKLQEQGAMIACQQKQIDALTAGLQKVSAQLELTKSAPSPEHFLCANRLPERVQDSSMRSGAMF